MNVVLVHPTHGAKVAINECEIAADEKNGWVRYNPDIPTEEPVKRGKPRAKVLNHLIEEQAEVPSFLASVGDTTEGL